MLPLYRIRPSRHTSILFFASDGQTKVKSVFSKFLLYEGPLTSNAGIFISCNNAIFIRAKRVFTQITFPSATTREKN